MPDTVRMVFADMVNIGGAGLALAYGMRQEGWEVLLGEGYKAPGRGGRPEKSCIVVLHVPARDMPGSIRQARNWSPRDMLVAMPVDGGPGQRIAALEAGADMCCPADTSPEELSAMLRAASRRQGLALAHAAQWWRLEDGGRRLVGPDGQSVPLTYAEGRLLQCLLDDCGMPLARSDKRFARGRAIDVTVSRLRAKAASLGVDLPLLTVREMGYMFLSEDSEARGA